MSNDIALIRDIPVTGLSSEYTLRVFSLTKQWMFGRYHTASFQMEDGVFLFPKWKHATWSKPDLAGLLFEFEKANSVDFRHFRHRRDVLSWILALANLKGSDRALTEWDILDLAQEDQVITAFLMKQK